MWNRAMMALVGMAVGFLAPCDGAMTQQFNVPCDSFVKNDDGSWSALRSVPIRGVGESFTVREGSVLRPGAAIRGVDLASILDERCPATPEPPAAPTALQPPAPPPRVTLGNLVNANGVIEAQRVTCAELADAAPDEATLFLAWYSGWYAAGAKKRGLAPARVQSGIRAVMDYCKGNRDRKIVQVMELMLK